MIRFTPFSFLFLLGLALAPLLGYSAAPVEPIEHQLDNGLRIIFLPAPDLPIVDLRLLFYAGSARDGDTPGLARLTNRLLEEGAGSLDAQSLGIAFDQQGAILNTGTARDMAWIELRSMREETYLRPSLDALHTLMHSPTFTAEAVEQQKQQARITIKSIADSASAVADQLFFATLYPDHPYGQPPVGTMESLDKIDRQKVRDFFRRYYVANNAVLAIVGDLTFDEMVAITTQLAGNLPAGERAPTIPAPTQRTEKQFIYLPFPSDQIHIRTGDFGIKANADERYALSVANHILGGSGLQARLSESLREQRGLTYHISSRFLPMEQTGAFLISTEVLANRLVEAFSVLNTTMDEFHTTGPTADELDNAIASMTGRFPLHVATNRALLGHIAFQEFYDLPTTTLWDYPNQIRQQTLRNVHTQFQQSVNSHQRVTVIVGGGR